MTLDPDCVSVRIDNSTASANRRPKIRLLVRSVLNSEVCMFFLLLFSFLLVFFTFLLLSFFFFKYLEPRTTCWDAECKLSFHFCSFQRWFFCYRHLLHSFKVLTITVCWFVVTECLCNYLAIFLSYQISYLNCQSLCSWAERKFSRTQTFGEVVYVPFYLITLEKSKCLW